MAVKEDISDKAKAPTALDRLAGGEGTIIAAGVPEGYDAFLLAAIARRLPADTQFQQAVLHIARDDHRLAAIRAQLEFFAPGADVLSFPAWDCVPYDRISPDSDIEARRIATLGPACPCEGRQARADRAHDHKRRTPARAAAGRDQKSRRADCRRQPA